ncbi:MAG: response regulator [Fibrobacterales bacterium]
MRILLVDDTFIMRKMQKNTLNSMGCSEIVEARNGAEALQKLDEDPTIGLVLLDWEMPTMSGLSALKSIKSNPLHQNTPVVMVTSQKDRFKVMEAIQAGVNGYIMVPFNAKDYINKIKSILSTSMVPT